MTTELGHFGFRWNPMLLFCIRVFLQINFSSLSLIPAGGTEQWTKRPGGKEKKTREQSKNKEAMKRESIWREGKRWSWSK